MKKLDYNEMESLELLNSFTEINFISHIEKYAENEACTELEVKKFLKENYPGAENPKNLTDDDRIFLSLLLRYYCQKCKEYSKNKKSDTVKLAAPHPRPSLEFYDSLVPQGCFKAMFSFGQ